ncbi:MAG: hypothetical protein K2N04_07310, partial [Alistipes sp.]|nr:hypothetical protein [Alistipes sp.]
MMTVVVVLAMGAAAWGCAVLALAMRARNARRLAMGRHGAALAASDGPGISVLCSGVGRRPARGGQQGADQRGLEVVGGGGAG